MTDEQREKMQTVASWVIPIIAAIVSGALTAGWFGGGIQSRLDRHRVEINTIERRLDDAVDRINKHDGRLIGVETVQRSHASQIEHFDERIDEVGREVLAFIKTLIGLFRDVIPSEAKNDGS